MFTLIAVMNSFFIEVEICGHGKLETFESNELFIYHHKLNSIHVHNSNEEKYTWSKQIWIQIKTNGAHGVLILNHNIVLTICKKNGSINN
jgi:hypothetical protein